MKKKKAHDTHGLAPEHLKEAPEVITKFITPVINNIFRTGVITTVMKEGLIHPVHKKGKQVDQPGNYRGITITPIITKVIDKILLDHQRLATLSKSGSRLVNLACILCF